MSTCSQIRLLLTISIIHPYKCYNAYRQLTGTNGEAIWKSTSDFIPVQSQPYGTIRLGQIMSAEFDFVWNGRTNSPHRRFYENFFRVGYDATNDINCNGEGARYPSFWLSDDEDTLHVSTSSGKLCQPSQSLQEYGPINASTPYHILIAFNNTQLVVHITGGNRPNWIKSWARDPTPSQHLGQTVPVWWMSNKHSSTPYNVGNGIFSNIIIKSAIFSATQRPTSSQTKTPSAIPTVVVSFSEDSISTASVEVDSANRSFMYYTEQYLDDQTNAILFIVGIVTCMIGSICLLSGGIKNRNKMKPNPKDGRTRINTHEDDIEGQMDINDDGDETSTALDMFIHNVIHNDVNGDLRTETVVDLFPECIIMRASQYCE
eukprot:140594_1